MNGYVLGNTYKLENPPKIILKKLLLRPSVVFVVVVVDHTVFTLFYHARCAKTRWTRTQGQIRRRRVNCEAVIADETLPSRQLYCYYGMYVFRTAVSFFLSFPPSLLHSPLPRPRSLRYCCYLLLHNIYAYVFVCTYKSGEALVPEDFLIN